MKHLLDIADLSDGDVSVLLGGPGPRAGALSGKVLGSLFLSSSLRTRVGFQVAAARLGMHTVSVTEERFSEGMTAKESFQDTIRTLGLMVDAIVVRSDVPLDRQSLRSHLSVPVINAGDPHGEHPTQALIDIAAMQRFAGPVGQLRVGLCGDLTMRGTRSLLQLLVRRPPAELVLMAPQTRTKHNVQLTGPLEELTTYREAGDFSGLDVLVLTGLAAGTHNAIAPEERRRFALTDDSIGTLGERTVVLSPGPVIDEIEPHLYDDPRVFVDEQARLGVHVRQLVLARLLG